MLPLEFEQFLAANNYEVITDKGQRIFRPQNEDFQLESIYDEVKKHEVFLSNLPNDLYENELLPFLCRAGPVYQIRLLMNFSGSTKGMAYVIFEKVESAYEAVEKLDGEYIRSGHDRKVRSSFSVNNNRLLIKDIPADKSSDELLKELDSYVNGIVNIKIFTNTSTNALVSFLTHQLAASARRVLVPKGSHVKIFGQKLEVEWAKPKDFKTLFVRFNCSFFNQNLVKDFFESEFYLDKVHVRHVTIQGKNAFVKFATFGNANTIFKKFAQLPESILNVKEHLYIENISWPIRK